MIALLLWNSQRLRLAINVLRGRPTAYRVEVVGGGMWVSGDRAVITDCVFTGIRSGPTVTLDQGVG